MRKRSREVIDGFNGRQLYNRRLSVMSFQRRFIFTTATRRNDAAAGSKQFLGHLSSSVVFPLRLMNALFN
jgi:hypothetical protein